MTVSLAPYSAPQRVSQARVIRSEWTKLRTQPSAVWALLSALALIVGFGILYCFVRVSRPPHNQAGMDAFDPTSVSLAGVQLVQLAVGALGVLLMSNEYTSGLIRTTFTAVPARLPILWGKALTFAITTLTLCVPATFVAFLVGQSILSREHLSTTLGEPGVTRAVIGSALYLVVAGMLGLGLGALLRNTAAAISTLLALLFGLQLLDGLLPTALSDQVYKYLPTPAGLTVTGVEPDPTLLSPWVGFGVFCLYPLVVLALAGYRVRRKDA